MNNNDRTVRLVTPQAELQDEYMSFYQEWIASGEKIVPWVVRLDPTDFPAMLKFLADSAAGIHVPEGRVPDSTFWLVNDQNRILGAVNIRHDLTEFLYNAGGHIGYGIRPSERRKGYATELLRLSLLEAKKLGIQEALVVCDADNTASEQTILRGGGQPDADFIEDDGNVIKRYWIAIR